MPELVEFVKNIIHSEAFRSQNKQKPSDFTRERAFPFHSLIFFLLNMNNKSDQDELDRYFQIMNHLEVAERFLYKGSLSKARAKLKHQAFVDLNDHMIRHFYDHFRHRTWHGVSTYSQSTARPSVFQIKKAFQNTLAFGIQIRVKNPALKQEHPKCSMF